MNLSDFYTPEDPVAFRRQVDLVNRIIWYLLPKEEL